MSDQRGLTIFQANDNLIASKDIDEFLEAHQRDDCGPQRPGDVPGRLALRRRSLDAARFSAGAGTAPRRIEDQLSDVHLGLVANGVQRIAEPAKKSGPGEVLLHLTEGGVSQERLPTVKSEIAELEKQMSDTDKAKAETMLQNGTVQDAAKN